jgi:hypothetical protein
MESSSTIEGGYSTPPRSNIKPELSFTFRQAKLLTSSELKRRFYTSNPKKRRYRINDSRIPLERNLNMPVIFQKLFDTHPEKESSSNTDDCIVPLSSSKKLFHPPIAEQENIFSISENLLREKLKILLEKK